MGNVYSSLSPTAFNACVVVSYGISVVFFLAPVPTIITVCKKKSVKQLSPIQYLATLLNCMMWLLYGHPKVHIHLDGLIYVYMNFVGVVAEAVYLIIFFVCSPKTLKCAVLICFGAELVYMAFVAVIVLLVVHSPLDRSIFVGVQCIFFGILMHAAPLLMVIQTKSIRSMPVSLSRVGTVYAICWTTFGLILSEQYVIIPNAVGSLLGIAQLVLHRLCFRSMSEEEEEEEQEEGVVTLRESLPTRARRLGSKNEEEFTILILYPDSRRGQQLMRNINCSPLVESGDTIGTVITWTTE